MELAENLKASLQIESWLWAPQLCDPDKAGLRFLSCGAELQE